MIRDFGLRGFEFWGFRDLGFRVLDLCFGHSGILDLP